mmetsp:Transcript_4293/g.12407  ORF Transcript_4293/g.12407 Transcript_4293/m.12407 type:complete len:81 (+) Transcript_4293:489-731(+)
MFKNINSLLRPTIGLSLDKESFTRKFRQRQESLGRTIRSHITKDIDARSLRLRKKPCVGATCRLNSNSRYNLYKTGDEWV